MVAGEQPFERSQREPAQRFNWSKLQIPTRQESGLYWLALRLRTVELWSYLSSCLLISLTFLLYQALQTVFSHLQVCDKSVGTYTNTTSNYGPAGTRPQNVVSRPPSYPSASLASYHVRLLFLPTPHPSRSNNHITRPLPIHRPIVAVVLQLQLECLECLGCLHMVNSTATHQPLVKLVSENHLDFSQSSPVPYSAVPPVLGYTIQIGVPDVLIGAVLGRGGSVVKDIMAQSGTRIHVSLFLSLTW